MFPFFSHVSTVRVQILCGTLRAHSELVDMS